jgi:predicted 3-demethylubiquinone-9 3-methyltransferase (glyoxalase superfamily)
LKYLRHHFIRTQPATRVCKISLPSWLENKYGVSWRARAPVVPVILTELMVNDDVEKVERVTKAMLKRVKLDIQKLQRAAAKK